MSFTNKEATEREMKKRILISTDKKNTNEVLN